MKESTLARFSQCAFFYLLISGCGVQENHNVFVESGDIFFDDAIKRMSLKDLKGLGAENSSQIKGFFFQGVKESCVVLLPKNDRVIVHSPNPAFCYGIESNKYTRRI